jgi:hypothetical protein
MAISADYASIGSAQISSWQRAPSVFIGQRCRSGGRRLMVSQATDNAIPSAREAMQQAAIHEAQRASEHARLTASADAEKKALIDQLSKPSGKSEHETIRLAVSIILRAVTNGLTEVQVHRFPNALCTDRGRSIAQQVSGWEKTLTGVPRDIYELWIEHLQPRGYQIKYQIIDFPGGMPGDIGVTLIWGRR